MLKIVLKLSVKDNMAVEGAWALDFNPYCFKKILLFSFAQIT